LSMASDDRFKKAQKAGADWLETARARAEDFLRELSRATGNQGRAQGAVDDLIEGSRKGTEQLVHSIRSEIAAQLGLLGLATKADLADLERRLTGKGRGDPGEEKAGPVKKAPGAKKATPAHKAATKKAAAAKKAPGAKKAAPAKKAPAQKAAPPEAAVENEVTEPAPVPPLEDGLTENAES